jgi:hypothetical protein
MQRRNMTDIYIRVEVYDENLGEGGSCNAEVGYGGEPDYRGNLRVVDELVQECVADNDGEILERFSDGGYFTRIAFPTKNVSNVPRTDSRVGEKIVGRPVCHRRNKRWQRTICG